MLQLFARPIFNCRLLAALTVVFIVVFGMPQTSFAEDVVKSGSLSSAPNPEDPGLTPKIQPNCAPEDLDCWEAATQADCRDCTKRMSQTSRFNSQNILPEGKKPNGIDPNAKENAQ